MRGSGSSVASRHMLVAITRRLRRAAGFMAGRLSCDPDMPELIHTCYRITDIDASVAFYEHLGFEEVGRMDIRDEAVNVFMGLPGDGARLELTYNHGVDSYELGTGYNHIAVDGRWPRRHAREPRGGRHRAREAALPGA